MKDKRIAQAMLRILSIQNLIVAKVFFMVYSSPLACSMVSSSVLTPGYSSS